MIEITLLVILLSIWGVIGAILFVMKPDTEPKDMTPITPAVTSSNPELVKNVGEDSNIITPKTPQRLAFEEQEALRKLNITPR